MIALLTLTDEEVYAIFAVILLLIIYYLRETPCLWEMTDRVAASTIFPLAIAEGHIFISSQAIFVTASYGRKLEKDT